MSEIEFTDQNFEAEVLKETKQPVLVDFWAPWCGPCQMQGPIIETLAKEYEGKAKIGKLDVDKNPEVQQKYKINGIPTLILFQTGEIKANLVGLQSKDKLKALLDNHLSHAAL